MKFLFIFIALWMYIMTHQPVAAAVSDLDKLYHGEQCVAYVSKLNAIQQAKNSGITKNDLIEEINESKIKLKKQLIKDIELVYAMPINFDYAKSILNECIKKGYTKNVAI